jgi:hypothetical protein
MEDGVDNTDAGFILGTGKLLSRYAQDLEYIKH